MHLAKSWCSFLFSCLPVSNLFYMWVICLQTLQISIELLLIASFSSPACRCQHHCFLNNFMWSFFLASCHFWLPWFLRLIIRYLISLDPRSKSPSKISVYYYLYHSIIYSVMALCPQQKTVTRNPQQVPRELRHKCRISALQRRINLQKSSKPLSPTFSLLVHLI